MAVKRSRYTSGMSQTPVPVPNKAGVQHTILITHTFTEAVLAADVLDLVSLGAGIRVLGLRMISENVGAINLKVGNLTGTPGSTDAGRTCGAEFFAAQAANAEALAPLATLANLAPYSGDVSIGIQPAADITAGATKKLHLLIEYIAVS